MTRDCFAPRLSSGLAMTAAVALAILAGCAIGPDYAPPQIETPPSFRDQTAPASARSLGDEPWAEVYRDPTLADLIQTALENNYDLRIAASRVEQARYVASQSRALLLPQAGYQYQLSHGVGEFLGSPTLSVTEEGDSSFAGITASWEIDLWGRLRRMNEADQARFLATEEAKSGVRIGLIGEVAQSYFTLLALDYELEIARRTADSFRESLRIFNQRLQGGVASKLEVSRAEAALANVAATIPDLERQIAVEENQIQILLGRDPGEVKRTAGLLEQSLPPEVPAGLPSGLLERRPDIRQASATLHAASAGVGAAKGSFFPRINLTGLYGRVSDELMAFDGADQESWSAGGNLSGPLFEGGKLVAQYDQARAVWDEARAGYEKTVRSAFQEVANALVAREKLEGVRAQYEIAVSSLSEAVKVSTQRYIAGKASYYEVLEAQQQLFPAENALAQTRLSELLVVVQLYKALGGGWEE